MINNENINFIKKGKRNKYHLKKDEDEDVEMKDNKNNSQNSYLSDNEMGYSKINRKRKGFKVVNRRIHPYKLYKSNKGDKRKHNEKGFETTKKLKNNEQNIDDDPMGNSQDSYLSDNEMDYSKVNRKRKGFKVVNRRIHPYKIYKFNQRDKRKLAEKGYVPSKKIKNNYRKWKDI